mgnify:CR=1 FL=1|jgi:hypothetical protein|tara:strand:- start:25 stop:2904 length:2880 start_codon:yes stop_codon:yes gene_type:complete
MSNSNDSNPEINKDLIQSYFSKTDKRNNKAGITPKTFYLPNRPGFVDSIRDNYKDYILKDKDNDEDLDTKFTDLFPHQKFVRDYLQEESPSRGLLLFHGLGVGKTCASISAAELLLNNRDVTVMLPASLKKNYVNEVLKCGHKYYTPEKHWKFIEKKTLSDLNKIKRLSIVDESIIKKNKGLWYAVEDKDSNYKGLNDVQKEQIMLQINNIIEKKYNFIHYNGITNKKLNELTNDKTINMFDNNIVIIDEVHNFISRVINGSRIAERLYLDLLEATNCKLLCLSGTPIINKPYEIGLLINLLKGWIKIYEFSTKETIDEKQLEKINELLKNSKYIDTFSYDSLKKILRIELIPSNFVKDDRKSDSMKIKYYLTKTNDDKSRLALILKNLNSDFKFSLLERPKKFTALPTNQDKFDNLFINYEKQIILNEQLFMRRILGTVSFFEYTDSKLFPTIRKNEVIRVDFSDIQLKKYIEVRRDEIRKEKVFNKDDNAEVGQVYKAFSRALCNFTFPDEIERPYPSKLKLLLDDMDDPDENDIKIQNKILKIEEKEEEKKNKEEEKENKEGEKEEKKKDNNSKKYKPTNVNKNEYNKIIQKILDKLSDNSEEYLVKDLKLYSPKFAKMFELINSNEGSSLVYSQFRTVEGIGIFKRVLEANGYVQFKIKKESGYELDIKEEDYNKPKFMEFTGDKEMTNILLDIFNNNLENVPEKIREKLDDIHSVKSEKKNGNLRGSLAKVMMITQSGSEGISLKNVRQVHVVEPYWNMIRINQVIGRAARTGSHLALPVKERNIDVYRYLSKFSEAQMKERKIQRMDFGMTTDEIINDGAERKAVITNKVLDLLKRSAVDCFLHKKNHQKLSIECFSYPIDIDDNELSVQADIYTEDLDKINKNKQKKSEFNLSIIKIKKKNYVMLENEKNSDTKQLFDYDNYVKFSKLIFIGLLTKNKDNKLVLKIKKQIKN